MSYAFADGPLVESRVAEFDAQNRHLSRVYTAHGLHEDHIKHPSVVGAGFPYSGDHLGTFSHRATTADGDPGEEVRRERTHTASHINVWDMVSA